MKRIGRADDVVMYVHSEFGRRVPENTSLGTDHGTAQVNFVIGNAVKGGLYGTPPSLTNLVLGDNLESTTDFRQVYATLIEEWLGADAAKVLGQKFNDAGACSGALARRCLEDTMATRMGWSPGPAAWKDDLSPITAADWNYDRAAHLLAHAGFGGTPAEIQKLADAGPRARRPLARALREHPESEDAAVRRIGPLGSDAERVSGEPARSDGPGRQARHLDGRRESSRPATGRCSPSPIASSTGCGRRCSKRAGWVLVGEPHAADHASGRAEDGAAVARPLRHPREQGPRLPQDDAADRPVRARRDGQPPRPDHPGRAEPGDAVLPGRAVQRQGRARTRTSPAR